MMKFIRFILGIPSRQWFAISVITLSYMVAVLVVDVVMTPLLGQILGHAASTSTAIALFPFWVLSVAIQGVRR